MAETSIEWADKTWNPLLGCERVSAGCDGCYAINTATIRAGNPHPKVAAAFAGLTERRDGRLDWTGRINLLPDRLTQPLGWKKPSKVFVNSQSDLFHKDVPAEYIVEVFAVMAAAERHTFQLLTKRHGRMRALLNDVSFHLAVIGTANALRARRGMPEAPTQWPLLNVHLGVSVENQQWADIRIPALLDTPAAVRWLSMEPLLGPVDLTKFFTWRPIGENLKFAPLPPSFAEACGLPALHWIVCGGESGPKARPIALQWARDLRDQSVAAGVPYFYKQWGEWVPPSQMPADTFMDWDIANGTSAYDRDQPWRVGKKRAGRLLDGRTWDEFPADRVAVAS